MGSHLCLSEERRMGRAQNGVESKGRVAQMFCCSHGAASPCFREIIRTCRASTQRGGYSSELQA
jgi:hypothetical protein